MKSPLHRLATRISLISVVHLSSMVAMIFLVSWATYEPQEGSRWMEHGEFDLTSIVHTLDEPALWKPQSERLAEIGVRFTLYDDQGKVVASNVTPAFPALDRAALAQQGETLKSVPHQSEPLFSRLILYPDGTRGHALFAPPPFVPPFKHLQLGFAMALIASATGAVLLARSFSRPLTQLTAAAEQLGTGDLNARAGLSRSDEFGQLSKAFDDMAERLGVLVRAQQEMLANMSHELRTPLARLRAALDFASEVDGSAQELALRDLSQDLTELERLVTDVLKTARLDVTSGRLGPHLPVLRPEPLTVRELVERAESRFCAQYPNRVLEVHEELGLPAIHGDAVLLRRALDNLIDNAQSYSEPTTPIALTVSREEHELCVSVRDRGIGISADDLPRVTEPFFRTDRSRARRTGGLGLGLSLTRRIVEAHGGSLHVDSQLGVGTTVRLRLPIEPTALPIAS